MAAWSGFEGLLRILGSQGHAASRLEPLRSFLPVNIPRAAVANEQRHIKHSFPRAYSFLELPAFKHWEISKEKKPASMLNVLSKS